MFAPRSRFDENALVSQAPGPAMNRPRTSPVKQHGIATTGKQRMQGQLEDAGQGLGSPKKPFKEAGGKSPMKSAGATPGPSSKRPMALGPKTPAAGLSSLRSALGDKTNNKNTAGNPFAARQAPAEGGQQGGKSPKKKVQGTSPLKSAQKPAVPQTPAGTAARDNSYSTLPSAHSAHRSGGVLRGARPFETPAANVGRKGMMKQKMGEILDAQRYASAGVEAPEQMQEEEVEQHWADGLTEEELYPEIEYMPPIPDPAVEGEERPEAMDGLLKAAEIGAMMRDTNFMALRRSPSPRTVTDLPLASPDKDEAAVFKIDASEVRRQIDEESTDDDEPFPDQKVLFPVGLGTVQNGAHKPSGPASRAGSSMTTVSSVRPASTVATRQAGLHSSGARRNANVTHRSGSEISTAAREPAKPTFGSAIIKPSSHLARADATRPGSTSRAASGSKPASSRSGSTASSLNAHIRTRPGSGSGSTGAVSRALSVKTQSQPVVGHGSRSAAAVPKKMKVKRQPHPALLNLDSDEVSKMVKEQIRRDEEEQLRELGLGGAGMELFDEEEEREELGI